MIIKNSIVKITIGLDIDRKSTRLNSSHLVISYAVFCLKKKKLVLPLLDVDKDVHKESALEALVEAPGQGPQQHDVNGQLLIIAVDGQVADARFGLRGRS